MAVAKLALLYLQNNNNQARSSDSIKFGDNGGFTLDVSKSMSEQFENGLKIRKQVMGEDFVERAFAGADDFTRPLQEFITGNAWGTVWCRDGLDLKVRSLITLAMLTALGRTKELQGHVRGALNNGATIDEIREVLLHSTVYCGVPLAVDAFRAAQEVLRSVEKPVK